MIGGAQDQTVILAGADAKRLVVVRIRRSVGLVIARPAIWEAIMLTCPHSGENRLRAPRSRSGAGPRACRPATGCRDELRRKY